MNARKCRVLLVLIALLIFIVAVPTAVNATVYMPPTPLPVDRTSISGFRLIASAMPGKYVVPAYAPSSGAPKFAESKWDLDTVAVAAMTANHADVLMTTGVGKRGLAAPLPRISTNDALLREFFMRDVTFSGKMLARWEATGELTEILTQKLNALKNPDAPAIFHLMKGDNSWFQACRLNGLCFQ